MVSIEKRGAGSPCGSFFSTVDDEFVPEIQAVYARAAQRVLVNFDELPPTVCMNWVNACMTLFAIHARTSFELPRHSPIRRSSPTTRPGAGDLDPLLEEGHLSRKFRPSLHPPSTRDEAKGVSPASHVRATRGGKCADHASNHKATRTARSNVRGINRQRAWMGEGRCKPDKQAKVCKVEATRRHAETSPLHLDVHDGEPCEVL